MKFAVVLLSVFQLVLYLGCTGNKAPIEVQYALFPPGFFEQGFREEYDLTGSTSSGQALAGTHIEFSKSPEPVLGLQLLPVQAQSEWVDQDNATYSTGTISFFSMSPSSRELLASQDIDVTFGYFSTETEIIPSRASIGQSGSIGTYSDVFGNTISRSWELLPGDEGNALFSMSYQAWDTRDQLTREGAIWYQLDPDGNRLGLSVYYDEKALSDPVSLVGIKR